MYKVEEDISLMEVFDFFAKRNGNWACRYKYIEILGRIQHEDAVFIDDIIWFEREMNIPIRLILMKAGSAYIENAEIRMLSDVKKYLGRKGRMYHKLSFSGLRKLLLNQRY